MKKLLLLVCALSIIMILGGFCMAEQNVSTGGNADTDHDISRVISYSEVSTILNELGVSKDEFDELTSGHSERMEGYDYSYLFDGETSHDQLHGEISAKRIAAYTFGEKPEQYILIDLEGGKYYYDRGNVINYVLDADTQGELDSDKKQFIEKLISEIEWPLSATIADSKNLAWNLAIETDTGVYRYSNIVLDEKSNKRMMDFLLQLYKMVWNS